MKKNNQKLKRPFERKVRFTKQEMEFVDAKIRDSSYKKFQPFALHMLIQGEVRTLDFSELEQLTNEVHKIGVNINQITKLANQFKEISSSDILQLTTELNTLNKTMQSEINKLIHWKERI